MSSPTVDILRDFLAGITYKVEVESFFVLEGKTYIVSDDILYARRGVGINVDGVMHEIFIATSNVIVINEILDTADDVSLNNPFYFHGTPIKTNKLLGTIKDYKKKTPMVYLYELIREREFTSEESYVEKESSLVMLILDNCKPEWETTQHYDNPIRRMRIIWDIIKENIRQSNTFIYEEIDYFDVFNHADFGVYFDKKGHKSHIFNENFSGIEISFTLPIKKQQCN